MGYEAGINLYAYVGNDPMDHTDPDGLVPDDNDPNPNKMPKNVAKTIQLVKNKIAGDNSELRKGLSISGKTGIRDASGSLTYPDKRATKYNLENKSGDSLTNTRQMRRMTEATKLEGKALFIRVSETAKISKQMQQGAVIIDRLNKLTAPLKPGLKVILRGLPAHPAGGSFVLPLLEEQMKQMNQGKSPVDA